jgi:diguanylate cyclase (GGDEF)-like protein/PAS domain S-box-containing protein
MKTPRPGQNGWAAGGILVILGKHALSRIRKLWHQLTAPHAEDIDLAQQEYLTKALLIITSVPLLFATVLIALGWVFGTFPFLPVFIILLLDTPVIIAFWLAYHGHIVPAGYVPPGICFGIALYFTYTYDIVSSGLLFSIIAIIESAMLQGIKTQWVMAALSVAGHMIIGTLTYNYPVSENIAFGITITCAFGGTAMLLGFYIQQLKQAVSKARDSDEQIRNLFERVPVGLYRTTPDGQILDANPAMGEMLGYPDHKALLALNARQLYVNPSDRDHSSEELIQDGLVKVHEIPLRRQDGEVVWVRDSFRAVRDEHGEIVFYEGSLENVTERKRANEELRRRAAELAALHTVSLEITAAPKLSTLLQTIVEQAAVLLGATSGSLYLCDPARQEVRCVTSFNTGRDFTGTVLKYGEGAAGTVALTGEPLIIDDYRAWLGRAEIYEQEQPFRSVLSCPMKWQDQVLGIIHVLHDSEVRRFTKDDLTLLTLFANQAAIALYNAQSYEASQLRARRLALLNEITRASLEIEDLQEMVQNLADRLGELLDADNSYITFWDEERQMAVPAAAYGQLREQYPSISVEPGERTITESVLRTGDVLCIEDMGSTPYISPRLAAQSPDRSMIALPLVAGEQKLGAALIAFKQPHSFTPDEITISEQAAAQIALAIAKMRLLKAVQHRVSELNALRATVTDISAELELPVLLRAILMRAVSLLHATGGDLGLLDDDTREIQIVASHFMDQDYTGTRMAWGEGAMGRALELRQPVVIQDYSRWEGRSSSYMNGNCHGIVAVPLLSGGRLVGALSITDADPMRRFTPEDQYLLELFAQQAAIAIHNARLYATEKQRAAELSVLYESSATVAQSIDLVATYNSTAEQLAKIVNATSSHILLSDRETNQATVVAEFFSPEAGELENVSDVGVTYDMSQYPQSMQANRSGKPLILRISDPNIDQSEREELLAYGIKSSLEVPMIVSGRLLGFVQIWDSRTERSWGEGEIRLCQTLANQAAVAIDNARLYSEMQRMAVTDVLTGIYNRRGLFAAGRREINRAHRFGRPLAAIMLDIDNFKQVNDAYSHAIGDQVLQALTKLCLANLREIDILGRFGGEEFAILLPEVDGYDAYQVAERLCHLIASTPIMTQAGPIQITVSMGVTSIDSDVTDLAVLLDRADTAMYAAKRAGRNRVKIIEPTNSI